MSRMDSLILEVGANQMELVDFRMYQEEEDGLVREGIYGINVSKVIEIICVPESITLVPDAGEFQEGIIDLRGQVIPVIHLARWMKIKEPESIDPKHKQIIVTEFSSVKLGFLVHKATQIRRVSWKDIVPITMTTTGQHTESRVTGTVNLSGSEVLLILDFESIAGEMGVFGKEEENLDRMSERKDAGTRAVLVADDSPVALGMVVKALRKKGYPVLEARNGQEALEKLKRERDADPDGNLLNRLALLITDIEMPMMDGYTLTRTIKSDPTLKDLPVLMHSSMSGKEIERKGLEVGADDYLVKFDPEMFVSRVEEELRSEICSSDPVSGRKPGTNPGSSLSRK